MTTSTPASLASLRCLALLLLSLSLLSHTTHAAPRAFSHHPHHIHPPSPFWSLSEFHPSRIITTQAAVVFQQWKDVHATAAWPAVGRSLGVLNTTMAKIEADALLAIKTAIHTDPLRSLANWTQHSSYAHCGGWQGVTCNAIGQVVGLDLSNMGLVGSISPMIGNLEHLLFLNLSTNRLSGPLPPHLIRCQALTVVDLNTNSLDGGLSSELLYTFPQLQFLRLSFNAFSGPLPEVPENTCRSLTSLGISGTNIAGAIPSSLKRCANLENLGLGRNQLSGTIPGSLGELHRLRVLQLNDNGPLTGFIPSDLASLKNLQLLMLEDNNLSGSIPKFLGSLPSLVILALAGNQFSGQIPSELGFLKKLKQLVLNNNKLTGSIPVSLGNCSSLLYLDLGNNNLMGTIPPEFENCSLWANLKYFDVTSNNLSGPIPYFFSSINSNLLYLDFSFNNFGGVLPTHINGNHLPNLGVVFLGYNQLEGPIPLWFGDLKSLQVLDLSNNKLVGSIPQNFGNLDGYKVPYNTSTTSEILQPTPIFTISGPRFSITISISFSIYLHITGVYNYIILGKTTYMDLSSNALEGEIPTTMINLIGMKYLLVSNNKLQGHIPPAFQNMIGLEILDLSQNDFTGPIPTSFSSTLNALSIFNVSFNNLSGDIPIANQFSTFGVSSYLPGNPELCGSIINRSCVISDNESLSVPTIGDRLDVSNYISAPAFGIGAICGFSIVAITTFIFRPTFEFVFGEEMRRRADIKGLATTNVQQYYGLFKYPT